MAIRVGGGGLCEEEDVGIEWGGRGREGVGNGRQEDRDRRRRKKRRELPGQNEHNGVVEST